MYRIIKTDGTELGLTDSVHYIKIHQNGCFTPATEEDAIGVAFRSIAYNLFGHEEIEGAETVIVSKADTGDVLATYITYDELARAYSEGVQNA